MDVVVAYLPRILRGFLTTLEMFGASAAVYTDRVTTASAWKCPFSTPRHGSPATNTMNSTTSGVLRSGINSVQAGQAEAARSIGFTFGQVLRLIVLPQAVRTVIPPLASVFIALAKNSAIAEAFGVLDAAYQFAFIVNREAARCGRCPSASPRAT